MGVVAGGRLLWCRRAGAAWVAVSLLASVLAVGSASAQGSCGAAGGAPGGASPSVCDYAREAAGLPPLGPAGGAGNPIDLVTGNKYRHELDLRLHAPVPLVFARHYNSLNRHAGPLGVGWSHSFETRLARVRAGPHDTVQVVQGDGRRLVFGRDPRRAHRWRTHDLVQGTIARSPERGWRWRWPDGRVLHFRPDGRLERIERDGDAVLWLGYDPQGRLTTVAGPEGGPLEFEYMAHPQGERLARITRSGPVARFTYDEAGQLASLERPDGRLRRYHYDDPHDPLRLTGVVEIDTDAGNDPREVARYAYDPQGRAVLTSDAAGETLRIEYALPSRTGGRGRSTVTDSLGRRAHYTWRYDRHRHLSWLDTAEGDACASCPPAPRRHGWDAAGRLVRIESPAGGVHLDRDAAGRPVAAWTSASVRGPRTLRWRAGYRDRDTAAGWAWLEQPSVAPGRTHRIELEHDARDRVVAVAERGWTPVRGVSGRIAWAALSRRFALEHRVPDDPSEPSAVPLPYTLTSLAAVDGPEPGHSDRIVVAQARGSITVTHPGPRIETLRYADGSLAEHAAPSGLYARMRHAVPTEQWLGGPSVVGAFIGAAQLDLEHDPFGQLTAVVLQRFERRQTTTLRVNDTPAAPSTLRATALWRGRPTAIRLPDGTEFRRGFDDFGRVAWIDEPGAPRRWARYDATDRLVEHHTADGAVLRHRRDPSGRLLHTHLDGPYGTEVVGRYRWDGPRLAEASNDVVSIAYGWDALGRLESATHTFADAPQRPLRWSRQHDLASRVARETLPDSWVVTYQHDGGEVIGLRIDGLPGGPVTLDARALRSPLALRIDDTPPRPAPVSLRHVADRLLEGAGVRHRRDAHGRRAIAQGPHTAQVTAFVHEDWRLRAERRADGSLRHWLWADDRPVALIEHGRVLSIVTDDRRAPVRAHAPDGSVVWSARYDRFGSAEIDPASTVTIDLRLPGQMFDAATGLHHNHWRTYDPGAGRYLERDPLGLQPEWTGGHDLHAYAGGDPIGAADPWGLARLTWFAITTGADGHALGRQQGFDRARWSFMIEDIQPVTLTGDGRAPPVPSGVSGLLFDPWGDFVRGRAEPGNGLDAITTAGPTGREVFAAYAAHYGGVLASSERFVIDAFDDRRASALAMILAASPTARASCVAGVLGALPSFSPGPIESPVRPGAPGDGGRTRLLACADAATLPVTYQDDVERSRIERYQVAAELQESPSASVGEDCSTNQGCRTRARIEVNGHAYWASYGRTQFTVTTFLAELMRLAPPDGDADARRLRERIGLDAPIRLDGRAATVGDALAIARRRVDATYRAFATLRAEFGRGLDATQADAVWRGLPEIRRATFTADTGLGRAGFLDLLGYVATGIGGRTEEEGRHAIAASATATVVWSERDPPVARSFETWLTALFASGAPYDHVSRAFLRDNLRRVLAAPALAGRFENLAPAGTDAWRTRQQAIELDLAQRVAVLHNSGRIDLATRPDLTDWLGANPGNWIARYVQQFVDDDARGDWSSLRCAPGASLSRPLQVAQLVAMPAPPRPGPNRRLLAR